MINLYPCDFCNIFCLQVLILDFYGKGHLQELNGVCGGEWVKVCILLMFYLLLHLDQGPSAFPAVDNNRHRNWVQME